MRSRTRPPSAIRRPRTCSSSTRCRASAWTTCSPPIRRPRTASPRCSNWRRRWADGGVMARPCRSWARTAVPTGGPWGGAPRGQRSLGLIRPVAQWRFARRQPHRFPASRAPHRRVDILDGVLRRRRPLDEQLDGPNSIPACRAARARPRARAQARRDDAAPARQHCAICSANIPRARISRPTRRASRPRC